MEKISFLITVHGFDIFYGKLNHSLFPFVLKNVTKVAKQLNKKSLWVATNIRELSDRFLDWGRLYHGAAMASVALLLENLLQEVYIASTYSWEQLHPHGSHPYLDPLWSTESLTIVHHGCEARRLDKIRFISQFPIVLETLRVCWINPNGAYNCGRCEKCLRTMIGLYIANALTLCRTFPQEINLSDLQNITVSTTGDFLTELIEALGSSELDLQIKRILIDIRNKR